VQNLGHQYRLLLKIQHRLLEMLVQLNEQLIEPLKKTKLIKK